MQTTMSDFLIASLYDSYHSYTSIVSLGAIDNWFPSRIVAFAVMEGRGSGYGRRKHFGTEGAQHFEGTFFFTKREPFLGIKSTFFVYCEILDARAQGAPGAPSLWFLRLWFWLWP